ncbi:hypothetical protein [Salimicrobium halophilum]|uniref:Uncharacterized protein n=1 Tax=Salimicrobium halophilum TaxID=86666 RepID=A0A1G8S626_9BACI|nr:hypothetical protein [Salimicrobium halophilum]SDJ24694.1 hypothetical protein SAMN04490247_1272 [Salimicrobium halophilum]
MLELLITHIPSTMLHILTGMLVADVLFRGPAFPYRGTRLILLGAVAFLVLIPDIPKLFGVLYGHSLITVPLIAIVFAILMRTMLSMTLWGIWWRLSLVLIVSSLGIDYLGNGVHLFYPVSTDTYGVSIIKYEFFYILPVSLLLFLQLRK